MTFVATVVSTLGPIGTGLLGSAIVGGIASSRQAGAAKEAAQTQLQGTQYAADIQKQMFDLINQQQAPYRQAGYGALTKIQDMLPFFTSMPTGEQIKAMPGYQFGLEQGLGSVGQQMNVLSPGSNVDRARIKFAEDYALTQGLPAYMKQRESIYNTLASIAGLGQTSTGQTTQAAMGTGSNLSQLATGGASALAGGQIGAANALAGGLQGIGNAGMLYGLMRPNVTAPATPGYGAATMLPSGNVGPSTLGGY